MTNNKVFEYDVFISHASEDKELFVRPFVSRMNDLGLTVWYDEFTLDVGDSLSGSIDKGLVNSRFGIVILSEHFLQKDWPEYELRSLVSLQMGKSKRILPIWHNIKREQILNYSPHLADTIALDSSKGIDYLALRILKVIRPEKFTIIEKYIRYRRSFEDGEIKFMRVNEVKEHLSPRRRSTLTDGQLRRVRIVSHLLSNLDVLPFENLYDSFLRDLEVEEELQGWEWRALVVCQYQERTTCSNDDAQRLFYDILFADLEKMEEILANDLAKSKQWEEETGHNVDLLLEILKETKTQPSQPD